MARATIIRNHKGELDLSVSGHYVDGARVLGLSSNGDEMVAVVHIPLKALTLTVVAPKSPDISHGAAWAAMNSRGERYPSDLCG